MPMEYIRAETLTDAVALLTGAGEDTRVLAGGQSLLPLINLGLAQPEALIDIGRIPQLRGVRTDDGEIVIGATTRHADVLGSAVVGDRLPLVTDALRHVGNTRVRNAGTIGGSMAHADPHGEIPLALAVLEARCEIHSDRGTRMVHTADFTRGYYTSDLAEDEILTALHVPVPARGTGWGFHEYARRAGDFAIVAAATTMRVTDGAAADVRIGLAGVADRPMRPAELESALHGARPAEFDRIVSDFDPISRSVDDPFVGPGYVSHLARVLITRALRDAWTTTNQEIR